MHRLGMIGLLALTGCVERPEAPEPGREIYASYCVACHGSSGQGDGPLAADLPVAPADLTGLAAANGGVFPTADVMAKVYGYPGRYQADVMPEFGPVLNGPTVRWTDDTGATLETPQSLIDLADYLKSIQQI